MMGALHNIIDILTYASYDLNHNKTIVNSIKFIFLKRKLKRKVKDICNIRNKNGFNADIIKDIILLHQGVELDTLGNIELSSDITAGGTYNIQFNSNINSIRLSIFENSISISYYNKNTFNVIKKVMISNQLAKSNEYNELVNQIIDISNDLLNEVLITTMNIYISEIGGNNNER